MLLLAGLSNFSQLMKEIKKLEFSRLGLACLFDQYMLFTHSYLMQGEKSQIHKKILVTWTARCFFHKWSYYKNNCYFQ